MTVTVESWVVIRGSACDQRIGHVAPGGTVEDVAHLVVPPAADVRRRAAFDRGQTAARIAAALNALDDRADDDVQAGPAGCVGD